MFRINIHEAKTHLSKYLEKLSSKNVILICKRNVPIAEIRKISSPGSAPQRVIGLAKGKFTTPRSFFDPLPKDLEAIFSGKGK